MTLPKALFAVASTAGCSMTLYVIAIPTWLNVTVSVLFGCAVAAGISVEQE